MLIGLDPREEIEPIEELPEDGTAERKPLAGGDRNDRGSGGVTVAGIGGVSGASYASVAIGDRGDAPGSGGGVLDRNDCSPLVPPVK
jgi:hypothetical protein